MTEPTPADPIDGDYLVRAVGLSAQVRAIAVRSTAACDHMMQRHQTLPTAAAAVCRVATGCLLLGGTIKGRAQISLDIKGDGPLGSLYGVADAHGTVRVTVEQALVNLPPRADGKFDVASAIGMGRLIVTKNLGMKEPYQGVVPLVSGEVATDIVEYFQSSEQTPSAMALGEQLDLNAVSSAGGWLLQVLPGASDDAIASLEEAIRTIQPVSALIKDGATPHDILNTLLPDVQFLDAYPTQFKCTCARDRFEQILIGLGAQELEDMAAVDRGAELRCHFCNTNYAFSEDELRELVQLASVSDTN